MTDDELLRGMRSGDRSAFNELVARYRSRVLNTCYRFLLNKDDAEDCSQEVFIEVYRSIHSFRSDSSLSTWIYRIAVSKSLDEIKKRKRKKRMGSISRMLRLEDVAGWLTGSQKADTPLHEKEQLGEIMAALDQLPDNQRVAFTLSKIEGYSNKEIAEIMRTSTMQVESFISRGKKKLSESLEKKFKE